MKVKFILAVYLLIVSVQTMFAQKLKLYLSDKQVVEYSVEKVDSLVFTDGAGDTAETHEWVDLGLPSGTLWATCNVGAKSPEEYGDYFAWGETEPKNDYSWSTYKYYKETIGFTKYCTDSYDGTVDNKTELEPSDDAATANWGSECQMPSIEQCRELINSSYTTKTWTTMNGVKGAKITSKSNGNSIFLPAAGYCYGTSLYEAGSYGSFWSRSLDTSKSYSACLYFRSGRVSTASDSRYYGRSVRPVRTNSAQTTVQKIVLYMEGNQTIECKVSELDSIVFVDTPVTSIELNQTEVSVKVGETLQLVATVLPMNATNKNVKWASSNANVATVDETGKVVAVAVGTCTIICSATDGSGVTVACQVKVQPIVVTSIELNHTEDSVKVGEALQLSATVLPENATNKNVKWVSSNADVATVDETGKVVAVAVGTCTITCSAADGSGVKVGCQVKVLPITVTSIELNQTEVYFEVGETSQLSATVLPDNATNKNLKWESSNADVATVDETGKVTAVAGGTCMVICSATDGSGVKAECKVTVETHEYVDLGLPSGTLWATCNVGANSPEEYGDYFAWGETKPKRDYSWSTYKYCKGSYNTMTKYCTHEGYGTVDNKTELEPSDDAATANWGSDWQMPSKEQFEELINSSYTTTTTWTTSNGGVYGTKITSKSNGNSIFLRAASYRDGTSLAGGGGYYWSRSLDTSKTYNAFNLRFDSRIIFTYDDYRYRGHPVRPVRVKN